MSPGFQVGPLAFPFSLLLVLAAVVAAMIVGRLLGKQGAREVESLLWQTLVAGLLVSRLAYVWQFREVYFDAPLGIFDIRDGGWAPVAGLIGAAAFAFMRQLRRPAIRQPLWSAFATGAIVWGMGTLALSIETMDRPKLPPLELISLEGATVKLSDFQGKPTVVNLWATWCAPCVREMPVMQQAQASRPAVNFVFINAGESPQRVQGWLHSHKLPLKNVLLDARMQAAAQFEAPGFPTTLFFDAKGELVSVRMGELSPATLSERLEDL